MNMENLNKRLANILDNQEKINADIEELNRRVEELKREEQEQAEKTPLRWVPEQRQTYFYVGTGGDIYVDSNSDVEIDLDIFKHTRVFKTEEEAKFEAERMKVIRELEKFAGEFDCELESYESNYFICYSYRWNQLFVDNTVVKRHELYFESKEKAEEAIEAVGEDRVKKYYLGVKDN